MSGTDAPVQIYILTRTGNRQRSYERLLHTLTEQTIPADQVTHLVSVDLPTCSYVHPPAHIINIERKPKQDRNHCPYDRYIAELLSHTGDGWVMVLDDDAQFIDSEHLLRVSRVLQEASPGMLFLQPTLHGRKRKELPFQKPQDPKHWVIDMANLIFHSSLKRRLQIGEQCGTDKSSYLQAKMLGVPIHHLPIPPGIWANCEGNREGADYRDLTLECVVSYASALMALFFVLAVCLLRQVRYKSWRN